jgi:hypothetical protein
VKLSFITLLFCILFLTGTIKSQQLTEIDTNYLNYSNKITKTALADTFGYSLLRKLCSFGGRLAGSDHLVKAEDFMINEICKMGFDSVFTQTFSTVNWKRGEIGKFEVRGTKFDTEQQGSSKSEGGWTLGVDGWEKISEGTPATGNGQPATGFSIAAIGGSIGTNGVLKGEVIEISNLSELDSRKDEIKGKIVFFNFPFEQGVYNSFESYGPAVNYRVNGAWRAAQYGAKAILIRSVASNFDDVPHTGTLRYVDTIPKIPAAALGVQSAVNLSKLLEMQANSKLGIDKLEFQLELDCRTEGFTNVRNIIAEIKGSEKKNEIIVIGGHFDSWDVGEGAHDDGAGCVQSIEVLYLMKKLGIKPKRTVRAVLFANEENGLAGGRGYGSTSIGEGNIHYAAIESDRGGFVPRGFDVDSTPEIIVRMQGWLPYFEKTGIDWIKKGGSGADISQIKDVKGLIGFVPDSQRYFIIHHSANDVFNSVDMRELELGSAAITIMTLMISDFGF